MIFPGSALRGVNRCGRNKRHRTIMGCADYVAPSRLNSKESHLTGSKLIQFYVMVYFERTDVVNNMSYIESRREGID